MDTTTALTAEHRQEINDWFDSTEHLADDMPVAEHVATRLSDNIDAPERTGQGTGGGSRSTGPSAKQLAFLDSLLLKATDEQAEAARNVASLKGGERPTRQQVSDMIDHLTKAMPRQASDKQIAFLASLWDGRELEIKSKFASFEAFRAEFSKFDGKGITPPVASALIEAWKAAPAIEVPASEQPVENGKTYTDDSGTVYVGKISKTGNPYCVTEDGEYVGQVWKSATNFRTHETAILDDGWYEGPNGEIVKVYASNYSGTQIAKILNTDVDNRSEQWTRNDKALRWDLVPMSMERALELGSIFGICVRCGAVLEDDNSIAAGIGPICATKGF